MMLDPRVVAVQGVVYTPLLVAVQGLLPANPPGPPASALGGPGFIVNLGRMMSR